MYSTMKRSRRERNQPFSRPRFPNNTTIRSQTWFRSHNESVYNSVIRNNNQQLSYCQDQIRPGSLPSFEASGGQFRPLLAGLNQHQTVRQAAMNGFLASGGGRQFMSYPTARLFRSHFRRVLSNYARFNSPRIPSRTQQFQEAQATQQQWDVRSVRQRNFEHNSTASSANGTKNRGHKAKDYLDKNAVFMRRKWQTLSEVDQCRLNEFSFSVVTYNLLSDSLLFENMFLYEECDQEHLHWGYRKEKLLAELLGYDAEILCLQEVDSYHYENWFVPKLQEAGYRGLFIQRTGGKPDGCAIFYRHEKFTLVKHKLVTYNTPGVRILDKDNVGVVVLLKANTSNHKVEDRYICVANTHLLFNKKRGDIKLAQLAYLFAEIHELAVLWQDDHGKTHCPIILCGDLNSLPFSPLYHFLVAGQLEYNTRTPAVISGQLTPSQTRRGPSSMRVRTPLLPWEFGVTADCQWRKQRESETKSGCTNTLDGQSDNETSSIEFSAQGTEWRRNNSSQRCEPDRSTQHVDTPTFPDLQPTPNPTQHVEGVKDPKVRRDLESQPNLDRGEQQERTKHTSQKGYFNSEGKLRSAEKNRSSACEVPAPDIYVERQENLVENNCFKRFRDNLTGERDYKTARQLEKKEEVIDLSRVTGSPCPHKGVAELNTGRKSNRLAEANWKADPWEKTLDIIDLTKDIEPPVSRNRVTELNVENKSSRISIGEREFGRDSRQSRAAEQTGSPAGESDNSKFMDLTINIESASGNRTVIASRVGVCDRDTHTDMPYSKTGSIVDEPHSDSLLQAGSSTHTDFQTEKTNYDNNGTISIPWKFKSVYTHRFPDGTTEVTTCHSKACCNVDYIFYTDGTRQKQSAAHKQYVQTGKLTLLGRLQLMGKVDFDAMNLLPNHIFPSDHVSLQARFKLT